MNRSVASRNLAGGFFGGVFGILISWYLAPAALPLGVIFGVVVGWWVEDIGKAFVNSFHTASRLWQQLVARLIPEEIRVSPRAFFRYVGAFFARCITGIRNGLTHAVGYAGMPLRWIVAGIRAVMRLPRHIMDHAPRPASIALFLTISAIVVGAVLNALAIGFFWPWPETYMAGNGLNGHPIRVVPFGLLEIATATGIATMILTGLGAMFMFGEDDSVRVLHARLEQYSRYSAPSYFVRELIRFFRSEIMITLFILAMLIYWVTLGGLMIAIVVIPVTTFISFLIGLYKIAQRSAHWQCFIVTLTVTGASALIFYDSFSHEIMLWTVALCAGLASGIATEGLRRLGIWWGSTGAGIRYLGIWHDEEKVLAFSIAVPAWRTIARAFDGASNRVFRHIV